MNTYKSRKYFQASRLYFKWEDYRDSVKRFFLMDKEKGQKEYTDRMFLLQSIIKNYATVHKVEYINAVIEISKEEEGMTALQLLAAGFELCEGNDFTVK